MNVNLYEILNEIKAETGETLYQLEKIMDSQYLVLKETIEKKGLKEVHIKHLGKFRPTPFAIKYNEEKKNKSDN